MTNISNFNINQNLLHKDINVSKKTDVNTIEKDKNFNFQKINTDFAENGVQSLIKNLDNTNVQDLKITTDSQTGKTTVSFKQDNTEFKFIGANNDTLK